MTANVECAGGGTATERRRSIITGQEDIAAGVPCGWKGERFANGHVTRHEADTLPIAELQALILANTNQLRTAKPCPRCHGKVELIEEEGS